MKKNYILGMLLMLACSGISMNKMQAQSLCPGINSHHINGNMVHFREDMRKLWVDHIVWTRNVILNVLDDLPGTTESVGRLLQNQDDIGNALKPYYGNAAGDQLTALLYGHITTAAILLTALKNDDSSAFNLANQQWIANADSIAIFLSNANPYWEYTEMQDMLYEHLYLTSVEAAARKNQDYAADITAFEDVHIAILEMADMLSCGIMHQFPQQFRGNNREINVDVVLTDGDVMLAQNYPNPFTSQTEISYYVPEHVNEALLKVYNSQGTNIRTLKLEERGAGTITIHAINLSPGIYSYSLVTDGTVVSSRKMVH